MKSKTIAALSMILGIALSTTSFGQARHDEKPHGMGKAAATADDGKAKAPATGGRHDAGGTSHGMPKAAAKKDAAKPVDDKAGK